MKKKLRIKRSTQGVEALEEAERQAQLSNISQGGMSASAAFKAQQLEEKANKLLTLDEELKIGPGNEALPPEPEDLRNDEYYGIRETLQSGADYINLDASNERTKLVSALNCLDLALDAAQSINAKNSLEKMLMHQAAACHSVSMSLLHQAVELSFRNNIEVNKKNVDIQVKLFNTSTRLMNSYNRSLQTFQRLRTGGKQNITAQYCDSINEVVEVTLGADPVVAAVRELMDETETWKSSATELLDVLEIYVPEKIIKSKVWPKHAHVLSRKLNRSAFFLRKVGIEVATGIKETKGKRKIVIRKMMKNSASCATRTEKKDKTIDIKDKNGVAQDVAFELP